MFLSLFQGVFFLLTKTRVEKQCHVTLATSSISFQSALPTASSSLGLGLISCLCGDLLHRHAARECQLPRTAQACSRLKPAGLGQGTLRWVFARQHSSQSTSSSSHLCCGCRGLVALQYLGVSGWGFEGKQ